MTHVPNEYPTPSEEKAAETSLGDLFAEVSRDVSELMRQEIELAKAELKQTATRASKGAGMYGGAGVAGYLALLFVSIAIWWGLGYLVGNAWSAVIVAVLWGIAAAILFAVGKKQFEAIRGMPQTVDSVKKIPETLKRNEENR
jgi:hypothetical protein